ncbi:MAG: GNAT family N-acetyltransferase [Defluviitaleaceae bacterium]|nr:GNAT family N-acetyltransferase [Defluviitaleaceae bacterium]
MELKFNKISNYKQGILSDLLTDAYSFDSKWINAYGDKWCEEDRFFFDNLNIADSCGFITTLNDEVIGFIVWDPRNIPEYAIIGHNCITPKYKGKGYGKLQLQEAVNRIAQKGTKKIFVSTNDDLIPAQKMYESVGFEILDNSTLESWQIEQNCDIYYCIDNAIIRKFNI